MILDEYAIIPDIFDASSYSSDNLVPVCLAHLKDILLNEALVRDLRDGEWSKFVNDNRQRWHRNGLELFMKIARQNRLYSRTSSTLNQPDDAESWFLEANASNNENQLTGIICPDNLANIHRNDGPVGSIERLTNATWWHGRSNTVRTARNIAEYLAALSPVLLNSNSLMFIDPHLDPSQHRYNDFSQLLTQASQQAVKPVIEIHRVCYVGSGANRSIVSNDDWVNTFEHHLNPLVQRHNLTAEIFIWSDFHDRFLISDIVGIGMTNGFDVSGDAAANTTWSRLGRDVRDDVQREFDPNSHRRTLRHRFRIE